MTQVTNRALAEDLANSLKTLEGMSMEELEAHRLELDEICLSCYVYDESTQLPDLIIEGFEGILERASKLKFRSLEYYMKKKYGDNYKDELPFF